jgi:hypothetical protein
MSLNKGEKQMAKSKGAPPTQGLVKARVISDCALGKIDDVVELTPEMAEAAKSVGNIDDHADAVAYAESLAAAAAPAAAPAEPVLE